MDKWREILNKRELPSIDENKKGKSIEILKMEIANTEITVKESYFEKIKRYIPFMSKITFLFQFISIIGRNISYKIYEFWENKANFITCNANISISSNNGVREKFKYNMYEIEMSCKMDLKESGFH